MFDAVLPLLKSLQSKVELYCIFEINSRATNLLPIQSVEIGPSGTFMPGYEFPQLAPYADYIPIQSTYLLSVTVPRQLRGFIDSIKGEKTLIEKISPDFVYFYNVPDYAYSFIYGSKIKWATAVHDPIMHSNERFQWKNNLLRKIVFAKCNNYFLFSNNLIPAFVQKYNIDRNKVHLTRLGVYEHLNIYKQQPTRTDRESINILFFGRIEAYKGVRYLLSAFKKYIESGRDKIEITIAGKGFIETDIVDLNNTKGLHIKNYFIPEQQLVEELVNCDVVICPYTDATQSGVIMSSFALCKPVIATGVGGLTEMVEDGVNGKIIKPSDIDSIYDAFIDLEKSPEQIKKWTANISNKYYDGEKSWNSIANTLLNDIVTIRNNEE